VSCASTSRAIKGLTHSRTSVEENNDETKETDLKSLGITMPRANERYVVWRMSGV
jgi:hypothetical protein